MFFEWYKNVVFQWYIFYFLEKNPKIFVNVGNREAVKKHLVLMSIWASQIENNYLLYKIFLKYIYDRKTWLIVHLVLKNGYIIVFYQILHLCHAKFQWIYKIYRSGLGKFYYSQCNSDVWEAPTWSLECLEAVECSGKFQSWINPLHIFYIFTGILRGTDAGITETPFI